MFTVDFCRSKPRDCSIFVKLLAVPICAHATAMALEFGVDSHGWWSFDRMMVVYVRHMRAWHIDADTGHLWQLINITSYGDPAADDSTSHRDD